MASFVTVRVENVPEVRNTLSRFGLKARDLAAAWEDIGAKVKRDAIPLTPVLTGRLVSTIRSGKGKSRATVRAGHNRMPPYAPIQHYGGYNNIEPKPYLTTALHRNEDYAARRVEDEIGNIITRMGLHI